MNPNLILKSEAVQVLTRIVASLSVISFAQKIFDVGLGAMAQTYIGYYRKISHAIFGIPAGLLGISIPITLSDFWALSFICAGAYVRAKDIEKSRAFRNYGFAEPSFKLRTAIFFIAGFTGLALVVPISAMSVNTYTENDIMRDALKNTAIVFAATIIFFVLNAFAPSA